MKPVFQWQEFTLRSKIIALTTALVLVSYASGLLLLGRNIYEAVENELGNRAMSVARTVAQVELVKRDLSRPDGAQSIEPVVERMRLATGVEYIVLFDMRRIRYSHPLPERIGTRFEGGDEGPSLSQQAYVSRAMGVVGPSVRAFVPVLSPDGAEQVGVVVVGILVPPITTLLYDFRVHLLLSLAGSLGIAIVGARLLAASIKRQMFDLEPIEMARLLEERVAVFSAVGEGLLAVDRNGKITVINEEAQRIIGTGPDVVGQNVLDWIPYTRLMDTMQSGTAQHDQQMVLGRTVVVVNRVPIRIKNQIVGAVATFRDRTNLHRLAEELTGVTRFVDGLRAQNHESMNKLHTIAGMIQLGKHERALDYIFSATEQQQEVSGFLARQIKDYRVSGLLLGKVLRSRELGIAMAIDPESRLEGIPAPLAPSDLVLVLGNLIENAMDALNGVNGVRQINCFLQGTNDHLHVMVSDNGPGIPPDLQQKVFVQGFSTKGETRGLGLALVKEILDLANGAITVKSGPGETTFSVQITRPEPPHPTANGGTKLATHSSLTRR